ncbi:TonB-dependent receptor [Helicobacter sp. MIT 21-1697]|uniref:TonB-dependent receptor n=1 Tax=Helicobacter sp. MIT 21-1697 TaxID=2993733 RepID=UPI00224B1691|nr:TonB-dependent receptor [Helicobacter sp. MIT 21-1697]MCX2717907.1 TonB-dependent receptor [Helicobacter sp. MIT 21-1697]
MKYHYNILCLPLICVNIAYAEIGANSQSAEKDKVRLEKSVVTAQAAMSEIPIELQSKQISVIDNASLLHKSTGNIQSILESAPGIVYSRSGGVNGQITFRGQNSNLQRSIVMIDGVRYSGRSTLEFNALDPYQFESVEILRGAGSSLWGSDAQNGVINFRSRTSTYNRAGQSFEATARIRALEYGSVNNLFSGRAEVLGGGGGWDMLIGFSAKSAGDYSTPIKENGSNKAKNSNFNYYGIDFNIGYSKDSTRYYTQGRLTRVESHRAGGLGAAPGSSHKIFMSENPISEYYLRVGLQNQTLAFADSMESYLYYRHWDTDIWNNRLAFNNVNINQKVYDNNYFGGRLIYTSIIGKHNLAYGAEFESSISPKAVQQINLVNNTTNTTNRPHSSTDFAAFIKDDFNASQSWYLSASLRGDYVLTTISKTRSSTELNNSSNSISAESSKLLDDNSIIHNGAITGALGSVYFLNDYISNVINLSHNFKAPSAGTRMQTTPSGSSTLTIANPLIKPEYSQTAEFGFRIQSENHFASLTGFYTYYTNMLALSSYQNATINQNHLYRYENIGKAMIAGAELEGKHSFFDERVTIHYVGAYNYGQNLTDDKPIAYLAPLYGQVSLGLNFHKWYFNLTQRAYGAKNRIDSTEERKIPAYTMTDIILGLKLGGFTSTLQDMELLIGASNLFNVVGRNPVTAENISMARTLSNPLVEPGRNIFVKYVWNY